MGVLEELNFRFYATSGKVARLTRVVDMVAAQGKREAASRLDAQAT
jgi:hypothetical protein